MLPFHKNMEETSPKIFAQAASRSVITELAIFSASSLSGAVM